MDKAAPSEIKAIFRAWRAAGLSTRSANGLVDRGLTTPEDVLAFGEQELLRTPNLGVTSVRQILERCKQLTGRRERRADLTDIPTGRLVQTLLERGYQVTISKNGRRE